MKRILIAWALALPAGAAAQEGGAPADKLQSLEDRISKLEGEPARTSLSAFNPAMGMALDQAFQLKQDEGAYQFRAAELNVEAPIDPFLKGWAVITGSNGSPAVDVEEAAVETTALPDVTIRAGRLFASMGRLAHFHDHELPVVDRPRSLDTFIGGETRADGVEASYIFPTDLYVNAVVGAYDKIGADNDRTQPTDFRSMYDFTYMGRLSTYKDLTESQSLELGVDSAWTPQREAADGTRSDTWRTLSGVDLTYRYQPARGGLYKGILWGTEVYQNDEQRFNPSTLLPAGRVVAYAGYSFVQFKLGLHWRPGVLVDVSQDQDDVRHVTNTYSAFLTYDVTEFQRLRAVYSRIHDNAAGVADSNLWELQWTAVLGHHVHGFRDR